jgi:hypothetical protein
VATGTTQEKAMEQYKHLLLSEGMITDEEAAPDDRETLDITVEERRIVTRNGESTLYIDATCNDEHRVFRAVLAEDEALMLIREGDVLTVTAAKTEINGIYEIVNWAFKAP